MELQRKFSEGMEISEPAIIDKDNPLSRVLSTFSYFSFSTACSSSTSQMTPMGIQPTKALSTSSKMLNSKSSAVV